MSRIGSLNLPNKFLLIIMKILRWFTISKKDLVIQTKIDKLESKRNVILDSVFNPQPYEKSL